MTSIKMTYIQQVFKCMNKNIEFFIIDVASTKVAMEKKKAKFVH